MSPQDDPTTAQGPGSRAANQGKTEPMPPTQGHEDPDEAPAPASVEEPDLASMNVGAGDPQAPSHPAAGAGFTTGEDVESSGTGPAQGSTGMAFRSPGSDGTTGPDEQLETDVQTSAARTDVRGAAGQPAGPGDAASVPVGSEEASPGTSQESSVAQGSRTPL